MFQGNGVTPPRAFKPITAHGTRMNVCTNSDVPAGPIQSLGSLPVHSCNNHMYVRCSMIVPLMLDIMFQAEGLLA